MDNFLVDASDKNPLSGMSGMDQPIEASSELRANPRNIELAETEKKLIAQARKLEEEIEQWDHVLGTRQEEITTANANNKRKLEEFCQQALQARINEPAEKLIKTMNERINAAPHAINLRVAKMRQQVRRFQGIVASNEHARSKLVNAFQLSAFSGYEDLDKPQALIKSI